MVAAEPGAQLLEVDWRVDASECSGLLVSHWMRAKATAFPLLRMEQRFQRDRFSVDWSLSESALMAADALLVWEPGEPSRRFSGLASQPFKLERVRSFSPVCRIRLPDSSIDTYDRVLTELTRTGKVQDSASAATMELW